MTEWKVIGISGDFRVTCGGKSTLADKLVQKLDNCVLISQDQFYRIDDHPNHEWVDISPGVKHQNWESMSSIDWQTFIKTIDQTLSKEPPSKSSLVIIEGHLIFNYKPILDICRKKIFLTLEKEECFARRDVRTYLPNDPKGYFDAWVWPMYTKNINDMMALPSDVPIEFIAGTIDQNVIFDKVLKSLEQLMN